MDGNSVTHVLNFFATYHRCFSVGELLDFADSDDDNATLAHALVTDSRFLQLQEEDANEKHFVPRKYLLQWFCQLSLRLARAKQARLSKYQVATLMSSLRIDGRWDSPPAQGIQFGQYLGFMSPALTMDQYVFPIAHILSFTESPASVTDYVIKNVPAEGNADSESKRLAEQLVQEAFSEFHWKTRYVVWAREGLSVSTRMTLQRIATDLGGYTREWVRQIEARFWNSLKARPRGRSLARRFSTALVCVVISRQGSLISSQNSPEVFLLSFLAKCAGVPRAVFPDTEIMVLGTSQQELLQSESSSSNHEETDTNSIANWLESEIHLCLAYTDLRMLAENIAQCRQKLLARPVAKPLTRGQTVYLALSAIGRPAHYTEVTEAHNSLFSDKPSTERNVHAVLSREQYGVVWIGIRGTFALREWGYERPSTSLFDTVTEIVREKHTETGQLVPFTIIVAEMGKHRQVVNLSSLTIAAHCNPKLRRVGKDAFIPREAAEEMQEEISADELDRILREFRKGDNRGETAEGLQSPPGKRHHMSRLERAMRNLQKRLSPLSRHSSRP